MTEVDHTYWYLSRAAGVVAYLGLFASVALGVSMTGGVLEHLVRRHRVYDLHRFLALLTLALSVFHALVLLGDEYVGFSLVELLLPFASPYRPLYTALGAFSLYFTALVACTFFLRGLVPYPAWRLMHYGTFGAFAFALAHGVGAGSDTPGTGFQYMYAATGVLVFNLLVLRIIRGRTRGLRRGSLRAAPAASTRGQATASADALLGLFSKTDT